MDVILEDKHEAVKTDLCRPILCNTVVRVQQEIVGIRERCYLSSFDPKKPQSTSDTESTWLAMEKTEPRSLIDSFQR